MRICYVGNFDLNSPGELEIANSLEELGHTVVKVPEDSALAGIETLLKSQDFNLLLFAKFRVRDSLSARAEFLKQLKIPSVCWVFDLYWGFHREEHIYQDPIFKADIVFTTDGGHQKQFRDAGVNHVCLRQGIYQKETFLGEPTYPTKAEIGFVGSAYYDSWPYRKKLIDFLKNTYRDRFEHFGQGGEVRHERLNNLCATLKIVVGDSVFSPYYWSNRVYEMIGRGGFLVIQNIPGLDKEFEPYKHYVPYKMGHFDNLKRVVDYYLERDKEREKIRLLGFQYCKQNYTYLDRAKKMLKILKEKEII